MTSHRCGGKLSLLLSCFLFVVSLACSAQAFAYSLDGTVYLADGEVATEAQIWYLPQLLEGMEGPSE